MKIGELFWKTFFGHCGGGGGGGDGGPVVLLLQVGPQGWESKVDWTVGFPFNNY